MNAVSVETMAPAMTRSIERGIRYHLSQESDIGLPANVLHLRLMADGHDVSLLEMTRILLRLVDAATVHRVMHGSLTHYTWIGSAPANGPRWHLRMVPGGVGADEAPPADTVVRPVVRSLGLVPSVPLPGGLGQRLAQPQIGDDAADMPLTGTQPPFDEERFFWWLTVVSAGAFGVWAIFGIAAWQAGWL